ncbi:MAG: hypothetical protein R3F31_26985 [Verrucomicrobiales bacterium]
MRSSLSLRLLCSLATAEDDTAPFRVTEGLFDLANQETLGLKTIPGEHLEVYRATGESGFRFTHHPGLAVFQGQLYCSWSAGWRMNRPGQRVVYARGGWPKLVAAPGVSGHRGVNDRCISAGFRW